MSCRSNYPAVRLVCAALLLCACEGPADPTAVLPDPEIPVNTAPSVQAGPDLQVELPAKTAWLRGTATDGESNIVS